MGANEYLEQVKDKDAMIKNLIRDKEGIKDMLYSLGGSPDGERVQTTRNNDKFGTLYGKIDEMEREIDRQIEELILFKLKVSREINQLKTGRYMTVLNCKYIHFQTHKKIAEDAFGEEYSVRYIDSILKGALEEFEKVHSDMLEKMDK